VQLFQTAHFLVLFENQLAILRPSVPVEKARIERVLARMGDHDTARIAD
jgi:hypothetical protein